MSDAPYQLICRDDDPQWLEERRRYVTGSVAPQLLGVHRYGSLLGTYVYMRGGDGGEEHTPETRDILDWGTDQQDAVVRNIGRRLGLDAVPDKRLIRSVEWPWMACTLDGWVDDPEGGGRVPFEVKTTRARSSAEDWADGVPPHVMPQVQHQIAVTGAPRALVAAVIFGAPPVYVWVDRDDAMISEIVRASADLFARVEAGEPPEPDGSEDAGRAVDAMVDREAGATTELDIEAVAMAEDLATLEAKSKDTQRRIREIKQMLVRKLGSAETGMLPGGGSLSYREQSRAGFVKVSGVGVTADVVAHALRDLPIAHTVTDTAGSTYRVLRRHK